MKPGDLLIELCMLEQSGLRDRWIDITQAGCLVTEPMTFEGEASAAIYEPERGADMAEILIRELMSNGVRVDSVITGDPSVAELGAKYGAELVSPEDLGSRSVDFVIMMSAEDYWTRGAAVRKRTSAEIVSLKGLLDACFFTRVLMPQKLWLTANKIKFCVCRYPQAGFLGAEPPVIRGGETLPIAEYGKIPERFSHLYDDVEEYSDAYMREIFEERPVMRRGDGYAHADCRSRYVNIINGLRHTAGQPGGAEYGAYISGSCLAYGIGADDGRTIASFLQGRVNDYYGSAEHSKCAVYNTGYWGGNELYENLDDFVRSDVKELKTGVYIYRSDLEYPAGGHGRVCRYVEKMAESYGFSYIDLTDALREVQTREGTYLDGTHCNHRGYRAIADKIWSEFLKPELDAAEAAAKSGGAPAASASYLGKLEAMRAAGRPVSEFFEDAGARDVGIARDGETLAAAEELAASLTRDGVAAAVIGDAGSGRAPDVVVSLSGSAETAKELRILYADVVSLRDVACMMWDKYHLYAEAAETFAGSGAYLCLCFWPPLSGLGLPAAEYPSWIDGLSGSLNDAALDANYAYFGANLYNDIPGFSKDYLREITAAPGGADVKGGAVSVTGGVRRTVNQPSGAKRRVHVFGGDCAFGIGAEDRYTLPSLLQEQLNLRAKNQGGDPVEVVNEGWTERNGTERNGTEHHAQLERIAQKLRSGGIAAGDIAIWLIDKRYSIDERNKKSFSYLTGCLESRGVQCLDLTQTMRLAQKKKVYIDRKRVSHRGYKAAAMKIYMDYVNRVLGGGVPAPARVLAEDSARPRRGADESLTDGQNAEFGEYLDYLAEIGKGASGSVGAIAMNCNPFTLGHRYLAETAARETDVLYVFVVEEDKSFFPFEDRLRLVTEGLSDIKNIRVLRSGKFIISTVTFPGYFTKDSAKEVAVDASLDLRLFGERIAPALGIRRRFAGSELSDSVTRQYNRAMSDTLPLYGVRFTEIDRTKRDGKAISASSVRALLERREWDEIRKITPEVTYKYLRGKFGDA